VETEAARATIRRLKELRDELNELDDQMSALLVKVEEALQELKLGVRLCLPMRAGQELRFDKYKGTWRLLVRTWGKGWETLEPLSSQARDLRALGLSLLPELLLCAVQDLASRIDYRRELGTYVSQVLLFLGAAPKA
jgi:hypothetical protein